MLYTKTKDNIQIYLYYLVNGKSMGKCTPDEVCVATWNNVPLQSGENQVTVRASGLSDNCVWYNND